MKSLTLIIAGLMLVLTACGDNKSEQVQAAESPTKPAIETKADTTAEIIDNTDIREPDIDYPNEIAAIRRVWTSKPLIDVAGQRKAGIEEFAFAFCMEYPNYKPNKQLYGYLEFPSRYDEENPDYRVEYMKKNGYITCYINVDLDWTTTCTYWNRKNGHKLVAFWLIENHLSWDNVEKQLFFYDYDPATDIMTPEPALVEKFRATSSRYDTYEISLPSEGKDINMLCHNIPPSDNPCEVIYSFRWNGNDFTPEKIRDIKIK